MDRKEPNKTPKLIMEFTHLARTIRKPDVLGAILFIEYQNALTSSIRMNSIRIPTDLFKALTAPTMSETCETLVPEAAPR